MSKTIRVTGASSGFGRDTAAGLREAGMAGVEPHVTGDAAVDAATAAMLAEAGRIDVLARFDMYTDTVLIARAMGACDSLGGLSR